MSFRHEFTRGKDDYGRPRKFQVRLWCGRWCLFYWNHDRSQWWRAPFTEEIGAEIAMLRGMVKPEDAA